MRALLLLVLICVASAHAAPRQRVEIDALRRRANLKNDVTTMIELGRVLGLGHLSVRDYAEARAWLERAIALTAERPDIQGRAREVLRIVNRNQKTIPQPARAVAVARPRYRIGSQFQDARRPERELDIVAFDGRTGEYTLVARVPRQPRGYGTQLIRLREGDPGFRDLRDGPPRNPLCAKCGGQGYFFADEPAKWGFAAVAGRPDVLGWKSDAGTRSAQCMDCYGAGRR